MTACVVVRAPAGIVLVRLPAAVPTTLTLNVHVVFAAMFAPVNPTLVEPATAEIVAPLHPAPVNEAPAGLATTMPVGSESVRPTPLIADIAGIGVDEIDRELARRTHRDGRRRERLVDRDACVADGQVRRCRAIAEASSADWAPLFVNP